KSRNAFIHYTAGGAVPIKAERIACIYENPREVLWIGTAGNGLIRLDTKTYAVRQYRNEPNDPHSLSSNSVLCVCRHSSGSLWVATSGAGLNRLDETSGHFTHFSVDEGLPSNSIYSILEDGNGRLWMSTNNGLAQFNISDGKFINYTPADGLQGKEFNQGAYHKGRSGMLYFGGLNGFNSFNPADIYSNPNVPPIVVTDFKIFGKSVAPDPRGRYRYSGHQQAAIDLSYRDNFISFEFAALEYSDSQNNQYAYKMEGFDSQWVKCGTRRYAGYTNLDGGNYTLRIRGSNSDGTWNMEGLTMHIKVNPPLWKTLWFRILLMVIFAGLLILVFWARTLALQNKIRRQEQVRETLTESKIQLEKANELIQYRHNEVLKLIAAISSILVAVDSSREVYQWNVPAEEFFNLPREKCVNRSFTELMAPYIAPEVAEEILEAGFAPSRGVLQKEITAHVGGHAFLLQVVINPIMDNNGRKRGILLLCENISNRKEEETKKKHLLKLKLIGEMYAGIMHEVNTPVQYISINNKMISGAMGNIDRFVCGLKDYLDAEPGEKSPSDIRDMMDSENVEETLQKLSKAGKLIDDGINRVMEVSRTMKEFCHPGQGKMERCDINTLINSSLLVSRFKLKANIDIRLKLSETPITIYCYPAELNLVFLNLILNAADALKESGDNGRITISTKIRDDEVHIEVADTGTGIHAAIQEKVFNPFFTTKKVGQGTGQGLAIALKIIKEKHGGKLFFKSAPGTGTVFYIHLPIGKTGGDATE
ncbi:MAG: PAS domain-containing protein, partial [bacterium]|nr:PAS domain-containing protein [bacterium]